MLSYMVLRQLCAFVLLVGLPLTAFAVNFDTGVAASHSRKLAAGGAALARKRHLTYGGGRDKSSCVVLQRLYVSSPLEQKWLTAARKWKANGNGDLHNMTPFCTLLTETRSDIEKMLNLIAALLASNTTLSKDPAADSVLSYFTTTMRCGPYRIIHKEHIESLVAALRHPFSIPCPESFDKLPNPPANIFDNSYVLLAGRLGAFQGAPHRYYLDAGAGVGFLANSNQHWTTGTYKARGMTLDRAIFWEANVASGEEALRDVPAELFPAFTHYNIAAPADLADPRNPLNVVTRLARPEDFVSVKLDIDAPDIEDRWLRAILGDGPAKRSVYATLIDELFWEHHFDFKPMTTCCWGASVDEASQLADSMGMFVGLRQLGIRSHYWQ